MRTALTRAAAYTRTGILRRFLEQLSESLQGRVDSVYAQQRLGLKGGDVRAFLQSLRVLGLIDLYGNITQRARRTRDTTQRAAAMRESLEEAYPELCARWEARGGMGREEVEGFFKYEYGLSASSASPAAKLFVDLMRDYGHGAVASAAPAAPEPPVQASSFAEEAVTAAPPADAGFHIPADLLPSRAAPAPPGSASPAPPDVRLAALDTIKSSLHIQIDGEWDEEKIQLVFDRMERLVDRILRSA
jgi:hypothetical protein